MRWQWITKGSRLGNGSISMASRRSCSSIASLLVIISRPPCWMFNEQFGMVRSHATDWGVDPKRIGVWGFSAGGHLASTAGTHFDSGKADAADPIDRVSCRPDIMVLAYPVISMEPGVTHGGSRNNLLGKNPDPKLVEFYSNEKQVTAKTPPTFLFQTSADTAVFPENSIRFYQALLKNKVPCEMHIYEKGRHGVGLAPGDPVLSTWPDRLAAWLEVHGFFHKS